DTLASHVPHRSNIKQSCETLRGIYAKVGRLRSETHAILAHLASQAANHDENVTGACRAQKARTFGARPTTEHQRIRTERHRMPSQCSNKVIPGLRNPPT